MKFEQYLSISDLMSGLMMVFLLISVAFMLDVEAQKNEIEAQKNAIQRQKDAMTEIVLVAKQSRINLHNELIDEFGDNLKQWDMKILIDNTVRFKAPRVLFKKGKSVLTQRFKDILADFFPRYINILQSYKTELEAIRIEGHTSSDWRTGDSYLGNIELSQQRSLATLIYCYKLEAVETKREWLQQMLKANGLSFAKRLLNENGTENFEESRRVEFKVITKAEEKLYQILERSQEDN